MPDALILGPFSVTSPRCLQDQSWNAQRRRVKRQILTCTCDWDYLFSWPLLRTYVWLFCLKSILGSEERFWEADENFWPAGKWSKNSQSLSCLFFSKLKSEQYAPLYECRGNYFSSVPSSPCYDTIPSQLVLFLFIAKVVDQSGDAIFQPAVPVGPRLRTQGFIPEIISCTVTETGGWMLKGKQKRKVTSAGRPRSGVDRQNQPSWPSGFPSGPDTLPDVWPGRHQTCLHKYALFIDY